jgi:hypothetical protein
MEGQSVGEHYPLTLQALRGQFHHVRYMEHYLWIGKNTGLRNFMDRLNILILTCLRGKVFK